MSERTVTATDERGSLPLALLVVIVVAGLASVLIARVVVGERTVRFDNTFTRELHTADAGVAEALFRISEDVGSIRQTSIGASEPLSGAVNGQEFNALVERIGSREWRITSVSREAGAAAGSGPERTVVAEIIEEPLFYPGAFGDSLIQLNGANRVDSYHSKQPDSSGVCTVPAERCRWGTDPIFGTENGSLGTNGEFDFQGGGAGDVVRPGGAFLYDWAENPGQGIDTNPPFGDRCDGLPCTVEYVSTVLAPLEYDTPEKMAFIDEKFADGGGCFDVTGDRFDIPSSTLEGETTVVRGPGTGSNTTSTLTSYASMKGWADPGPTHPMDPAFQNYFCATSLQFYDDVNLQADVDSDNPVVIFVRNSVSQGSPNKRVACIAPDGAECHSDPDLSGDTTADPPRPVADWLQVYVAGLPTTTSSGSDVSFRAGGRVAGVFYAPRSVCGSPGSGGLDVYGIVMCRSMQNVGNWKFHFDDNLGDRGTASFVIGSWNEE